MVEWLSNVDWKTVGIIVSTVVAASSAALHVIAPLTKWTGDDKAAKWLGYALVLCEKLSLNKQLPPKTEE